MTTYLLTWNPARYLWDDMQENIQAVRSRGYYEASWSSGRRKQINPGDRVFLIKLGKEPRGIVASGWVFRKPHWELHWPDKKQGQSKEALMVGVHFDTILDPEVCFPYARLGAGMHWSPQGSGVSIPDDVAAKLEEDWARFLDRPVLRGDVDLEEGTEAGRAYAEGAVRQITVNSHERSAEARAICILRHGTNCAVCEFSFEGKYGEIGTGFIHVHHLRSLSEVGEGYVLNPIEDLRPVCPNCHAMLHQRRPAYSIEEIRGIIRERQARGR